MNSWDRKSKFALLSIFSNTTLIIMKIAAGVLSGSKHKQSLAAEKRC
jgi:divalent metal cation (Fe/Co/Zn/Cd) transporter